MQTLMVTLPDENYPGDFLDSLADDLENELQVKTTLIHTAADEDDHGIRPMVAVPVKLMQEIVQTLQRLTTPVDIAAQDVLDALVNGLQSAGIE